MEIYANKNLLKKETWNVVDCMQIAYTNMTAILRSKMKFESL